MKHLHLVIVAELDAECIAEEKKIEQSVERKHKKKKFKKNPLNIGFEHDHLTSILLY